MATNSSSALEQLSSLLSSLESNQYSIPLHIQHIALSSTISQAIDSDDAEGEADADVDPVGDAIQLCHASLALPPSLWLGYLRPVRSRLELTDKDAVKHVLELLDQAEKDYFSVDVLKFHIELLRDTFDAIQEAGGDDDDDDDEEDEEEGEGEKIGFGEEKIRVQMRKLVDIAVLDTMRGHEVWDVYRDWELERISSHNGSQKQTIINGLDTLHQTRLAQPHSTHQLTLDSYSSFVSNFRPSTMYEESLVAASAIKQEAARVFSRRERFELGEGKVDWEAYVGFEKKKVDPFMIRGVCERGITEVAEKLWDAYRSSPSSTDNTAMEIPSLQSALSSLWVSYTFTFHTLSTIQSRALFPRAVRSAPWSSNLWCGHLRSLESVSESLDQVYSSALSVTDIGVGGSDDTGLEDIVLARAASERRKWETGEGGMEDVIAIVEGGLEVCRNREKERRKVKAKEEKQKGKGKEKEKEKKVEEVDAPTGGGFKLEYFLSDLYRTASESSGNGDDGFVELESEVWKSAAEWYKTSSVAWCEYVKCLIRSQKHHEVRTLLHTLSTPPRVLHLSSHTQIWDTWLRFESIHGTLDDEEKAAKVVEEGRAREGRKKAKEAEEEKKRYQEYMKEYERQMKEYQDYYQQQPQAEASGVAAAKAAEPVKTSGMDVDAAATATAPAPAASTSSSNGLKRRHEDSPDPAGANGDGGAGSSSKKPKLEEPLKRDRENTTVIVSNLPSEAKEEDLERLFKDCGAIREVKVTQLLVRSSGKASKKIWVGTVEFKSRDSIPAALTKDKKRLPSSSSSRSEEDELSVSMAWQTTLYVTNFPESTDDESLRGMFEPYGAIFETRWPSKKFKSSRRFCYVQFTEPAAAQAAVKALHGKEFSPGQAMSVLMSDPGRKKERTDAGADEREVYVAGLARGTTKEDLEKVFKQIGLTPKDVRIALDDGGVVKGFAFVEFDDEASAQKALQANNVELKKRRLAVTLADSRARAKQRGATTASGQSKKGEMLSRSIRVTGLPNGVQEGLLQQLFEKHGVVEQVDVNMKLSQAVVTFSNVAEAGKVLLLPEPITYDGTPLTVIEEAAVVTPLRGGVGTSATSSTPFVPRAAAGRRPRGGLGSKRGGRAGVEVTSSAGAPSFVPATASASKGEKKPKGLGQDAFRDMLKK